MSCSIDQVERIEYLDREEINNANRTGNFKKVLTALGIFTNEIVVTKSILAELISASSRRSARRIDLRDFDHSISAVVPSRRACVTLTV